MPAPRERGGVLTQGAALPVSVAQTILTPPAVGDLTLADVASSTRVTAELIGDVEPSNYPAADVIALLGQTGRATYNGRPPLQLKLPLLIETWGQGTVTPVLRAINDLYGIGPKPTQARTPAVLRVLGTGVDWAEPALRGWRWALTGDPEWGEKRGEDRATQYAEVTLTVIELNPAAEAALTETKGRTVTVRKGGPDTLTELAQRYATTWYRLVSLNPKLPASKTKKIAPKTRVVIG